MDLAKLYYVKSRNKHIKMCLSDAYNCHSILNVTDYCKAKIQYNNPSKLIYARLEVTGTYSGVPVNFGWRDSLDYSVAQVIKYYTDSNARYLYADYAYKINGISIYSVYLSD